jgi:phosphatidylglycerophosphate synthase
MLGSFIIGIGDRLLMPLNSWLMRVEAKPYAINAAELAAAAACSVCFAKKQIAPAILLLLIHGVFDYLDGGVQRIIRKSGESVHSNPFSHVATDKLSDMLLFLSLGWGRLIPWWLSLAACVATVLASICGLWGNHRQGLPISHCLFDRSDKIITILLLSPFLFFSLAVFAVLAMNATVIAQRCWIMGAKWPRSGLRPDTGVSTFRLGAGGAKGAMPYQRGRSAGTGVSTFRLGAGGAKGALARDEAPQRGAQSRGYRMTDKQAPGGASDSLP